MEVLPSTKKINKILWFTQKIVVFTCKVCVSKKLPTLSAISELRASSFSLRERGRLASISASDLVVVSTGVLASLTKETPSKSVICG